MAAVDRVIFRGVIFRRYPDSPNWADRSYFTPGIADRQRGIQRLHQEVWKAANGPIPEGCHVHHRDEDPLNNSLGNLECLTGDEHLGHHMAHRDHHTPQRLALLEAIRPLAAAWHRSDAGRAWHRQHGVDTWAKRRPIRRACDQCQSEFDSITRRDNDRFCSNNCKSKWRKASGVDDEDRTCGSCGATFRINKYARARTCSRICGAQLRRRREAS
ncbi:HNH endonuclease signature motif containing protein [Streptomyces xanthochromogenes]|uniref:HNH endonuclease signature motif containing protein n=1 Tax=Streptomyces xanthochromogenes TaxID=67384 RepID=UPI0038150310